MAQKSHAREFLEKFRGISLLNTIGKNPGDPLVKLRALESEMQDSSVEHNVTHNNDEGTATDHFLFEDNSVLVIEWNGYTGNGYTGSATALLTEKATLQFNWRV